MFLLSSVNQGLYFGDSFTGYSNEGVGKMYYGFFLICIWDKCSKA